VVARPPSRLYEFQNTVRRHKFGFAAVAALITVLMIGALVSTIEAIRALRAEREQSRLAGAAREGQANETLLRQKAVADQKKAESEAAKSRQVSALLEAMLKGVNPDEAAGLDTTLLRKILDRTAEQVRVALKDQPELEAELLHTVGFVYQRLGELATAEATYREALAILQNLAESGNFELACLLSDLLDDLGSVLSNQGKLVEAEAAGRESVEMHQELFGNEALKTAFSLSKLSETLLALGKLDEAEALEQESLAMRRKLAGNESWDAAMSLRGLGNIRRFQGRLAEAEALTRQELSIAKRQFGDQRIDVAFSLNNLAAVLVDEGKLVEAEALVREALAIQRKLYQSEGLPLVSQLQWLGDILCKEGKLPEAEDVLRDVLQRKWKRFGVGNPSSVEALNNLLDVLLAQHKDVEAEQLLGDWVQAAPEGQPQKADVLRTRLTFFARRGRWKEAVADATKLVGLELGEHWNYHLLAPLQAQAGDLDGYRKTCQQVVARFRETKDANIAERMVKDCLILPDSGTDLLVAGVWAATAVSLSKDRGAMPWIQFSQSLAEYRRGHFAGAVDWAQKALSHAGDILERDVEAYMVLAMAQYGSKQAEEASAVLGKGVELAEKRLPKLDSGDLGNWHDWIIAHFLMREALALIPNQPANATGSKSEPH
jgi:eukaryotic-like serine/threonine-protein kinase